MAIATTQGKCKRCKKKISKGAEILYNYEKGWVHSDCEEKDRKEDEAKGIFKP